ncbi:MAG: 3-oxoacyl-ACP reductase FabG [Kiritimatiellae bacterium]|nr:3-oxoacyl-ACP reductase FabG [Kiritimatiellia bacterium]
MEKPIAIVTGAGQGIGRAIAFALAKDGVVPVVADLNSDTAHAVAAKLAAAGVDALGIAVDVSDVAAVDRMVQRVADKYGTVHILVNNAGILHATPIEDIREEEWDQIMAVNLKSVFFCSQKVLPHMKRNGKGRIINISSLAGRMGGYKNGLAYSASKAGIIGLTMGFARRVAMHGITVNAVAPGTTESDIIRPFSDDKIAELRSRVPLGRLGKPEDIAELVRFLASDAAGFITGAVIDVNGGMFMG